MPDHSLPLIATLASAFGLALVLGLLATRLRLPALVGYLLAGLIIGPFTPGYVADVRLSGELAEIGIMLLMFGVGLHFSLEDLLQVRRIAVPGALLQITAATLLGALMAWAWGWPLSGALVFGLALSVASTVVLLRALESRGLLASLNGRIAVGWLIVEDLAMVLVLVLLPALSGLADTAGSASETGLWRTLGVTLLKVLAFLAFMLVVGRKLFPRLLWLVAREGSRELFTLCVVAAALGIAFAAGKLFGVSFALGAFLAGMVMRESEFSHRAAVESLPLREAFAVLFFVAVGMLFDPRILLDAPLQVLGVVAIIIIGKSIAAVALVLAMGYPLNTALTVSLSLAQIGEFSFILATLGTSLGLLPASAQSLIVAGALVSIALNPMLFSLIEPLRGALLARSAYARRLEARPDPYAALPADTESRYLQGHLVLVGYGRVGRRIAAALQEQSVPVVIVEQRREAVEALRTAGQKAVTGDAVEPETLIQAHIAHAAVLVVAIADTAGLRRMVETARTLNPGVKIIARTHSEEEIRMLQDIDVEPSLGEDALAGAMTARALATLRT